MPVVDGLPRPERRRHIPPRHTTPRPPEHPVEHRAVVAPPPTPTRGLIRQQRLQPSPLLIGQVMTMQHTKDLPHPALKIRGTRSSRTPRPAGDRTAPTATSGAFRCPYRAVLGEFAENAPPTVAALLTSGLAALTR